jgi:hypothetical protein
MNRLRAGFLIVPDVFVHVQVMMAGVFPRVITAHPIHHEFAEMVRAGMPHANGAVQCGFNARLVEIIESVAVPRVERFVRRISMQLIRHPARLGFGVGGACSATPLTRRKSRVSEAKPADQKKPTHQSMLNPNHHADHCHRPASAASRLSNCASAAGKAWVGNSSRLTHFNAAQSSGCGSPAES